MISKEALIQHCIQKVASGPRTSKSLDFEESRMVFSQILSGKVDWVQAAVLLISLRMKQETQTELAGALSALNAASFGIDSEFDSLMQIVDPFDGFKRQLCLSAFLPPIMATLGIFCVAVGAADMPPKYGVNIEKTLIAAGYRVPKNMDEAARRLKHSGWVYVPQWLFCPSLSVLKPLREKLIKRSCLTTIEGAVRPFRAARNHWVKGYVHKEYEKLYAHLAQVSDFDSALIIKGREGGVIPSFEKPIKAYRYSKQMPLSLRLIDPDLVKNLPILPALASCKSDTGEINAQRSAHIGLSIIKGQNNNAMLIHAASFLAHTHDTKVGAAQYMSRIIDCLSQKDVWNTFVQGCS